jgi:ubiquitin-small subunit ribosomal protein S27Ae
MPVKKKEEAPAAAPPKKETTPAKGAPAAPPAEEAAAPAAKKPEKKREKKHRVEKGVHAMYKVEAEKVTRVRPTCERCGPGYFMAEHHDRYTCGHCGFTRYKQK